MQNYNDTSGGGAQFIGLALALVVIAGMWKAFTKAKQPGWTALIPIYNVYIWLKIIGRPGWWLLLLLVPIVNFIVLIVMTNDMAKAFGKGVGYTLFLLFLPFIAWPVLGFGSAQYKPIAR